ncbi:MAG TPA: DedA family protein [Rhizomicrobium sp.]
MDFTVHIAHAITAAISRLGYPGIVLLMALESACLPVPSELVMPFSGYLASHGRFSFALAVLSGAIGCSIGSTALYYFGATGGQDLLKKWGRYAFLGPRRLARVQRIFERHGEIIVFVGRIFTFVPVIVSFPAGLARMAMWKFQIYTFAGSLLWCLALAWMGYEFGTRWESLSWVQGAIHFVDYAALVLIMACVTWLILRRLRGRTAES